MNGLDKREDACNVYFKSFLYLWSIGLVSPTIGPTREGSSSEKMKRREYVPTSAPKSMKQKKDQKENDTVVIEDPDSPVAKGELVVVEK